MSNSQDAIRWKAHATIIKYEPDSARAIARDLGHEPTGPELRELERLGLIVPDEILEVAGNLLTTAGLDRLTSLFIGAGGQAFTNSRAAVGVGNSSTAATVSDTSLGGNSAGNSYWQAPDVSNPTQSNGTISCSSTFGASDANFAWNEWGLGIATAAVTANAVFATATTSGILINHKVQSMGTKVDPAIWTLAASITIS